MSPRRLWLLAIGAILVSPVIAIEALDVYGLQAVRPIPAIPAHDLSPLELETFWLESEAEPQREVRRVHLWNLKGFMSGGREYPGSQISWLVTRRILLPHLHRRGTLLTWIVPSVSLHMWLTRHWTGDDLTQFVANESYFGRHATGLDAAARAYFAKRPDDLQPHELALLAVLPRSPSSPLNEGTLARRNDLLRKLTAAGALSSDVLERELAQPLSVIPSAP